MTDLDTDRCPSALDQLAEEWLDQQLQLRPELRVRIGHPGDHSAYTDYSPAGAQERDAVARRFLRRVESLPASDLVDVATKAELARTIRHEIDLYDAGAWRRDLNVIESPAQFVREIFDSMTTESADDWDHVSTRLGRVPEALASYTASLRAGLDAKDTPALRQVRAVAAQARRIAGASGYFDRLVGKADVSRALHDDIVRNAGAARGAYASLATFLEDELSGRARATDAVGRDEYALHARGHIGADIDLDDTYDWGLHELARIAGEQTDVAKHIAPDLGVDEVADRLDEDPAFLLHGSDELQAWMQGRSDDAVARLHGTHFDIPAELTQLECRIASTPDGGIYYTEPSDDFARPGRMWWSPPEDVTQFSTWRELTTVFHEGVPGHHLQCGLAIHNRAELNSWRRVNWNACHGEGWALYAEQLMSELGFLDEPAYEFGMLAMQRLRAARVVIDIGVHLQKPLPGSTTPWTAEHALAYIKRNSPLDDGFARFEIDRYLGWPAQAPSYKVGQRIWESLRQDWTARGHGDVRAFHTAALRVGSVGLDTLRHVLLGAGPRDDPPAPRHV
jgi:uncharacterized protein (DUF885 family)